jgi:HD-GYP domain-containing protein (c-di-GMP phosphodiesterase class II)
VDRKSSFTHIHSKRVVSIARKLGEKLNMGQEDLFLLEMAGELHDIGKLSIPLSILHKKGDLTADEYRIIRQHTYYTYYLIDRLDMMDKVRDWAAFHHEKLDGSGYPFHLKGDELDLGSRIMALADITTALSEDRPYRKALSKEEIMDILWTQVRDNKVDGDVVRTLEKNFDYIVLQ